MRRFMQGLFLAGRAACHTFVIEVHWTHRRSSVARNSCFVFYVPISNLCSQTIIVFEVAPDGRRNILG
jgi:hypothetical protein